MPTNDCPVCRAESCPGGCPDERCPFADHEAQKVNPFSPPCDGNPGAQWIRDAKDADGKAPMFQILAGFAPALAAIARVSVMGYHKHTKRAREKLIAEEGTTPEQAAAAIPYNNWLNGAEETYLDALARHFVAEGLGEAKPADSEELHLTHLAWNALAALTLKLRRAG